MCGRAGGGPAPRNRRTWYDTHRVFVYGVFWSGDQWETDIVMVIVFLLLNFLGGACSPARGWGRVIVLLNKWRALRRVDVTVRRTQFYLYLLAVQKVCLLGGQHLAVGREVRNYPVRRQSTSTCTRIRSFARYGGEDWIVWGVLEVGSGRSYSSVVAYCGRAGGRYNNIKRYLALPCPSS